MGGPPGKTLGCCQLFHRSPRVTIYFRIKLAQTLHRSHFGSRYKLGCCGNASLFWAMSVCQERLFNATVGFSNIKDFGPRRHSCSTRSIANTEKDEPFVLVEARKLTTSREILLWMTPSEAPKALQASECSELLDPMRASCKTFAQH